MSKCCIIKSNTPELRQRLEQSGISVCICSSFKEADWPDGIDDLSKVVKDIKRSHSNSESHCGSCKPPVKIEQYNEDILVQVFNSVADAAHWCVDNGYAKTYNGGVRSHIIHK